MESNCDYTMNNLVISRFIRCRIPEGNPSQRIGILLRVHTNVDS